MTFGRALTQLARSLLRNRSRLIELKFVRTSLKDHEPWKRRRVRRPRRHIMHFCSRRFYTHTHTTIHINEGFVRALIMVDATLATLKGQRSRYLVLRPLHLSFIMIHHQLRLSNVANVIPPPLPPLLLFQGNKSVMRLHQPTT